jgi:hypothetical protein
VSLCRRYLLVSRYLNIFLEGLRACGGFRSYHTSFKNKIVLESYVFVGTNPKTIIYNNCGGGLNNSVRSHPISHLPSLTEAPQRMNADGMHPLPAAMDERCDAGERAVSAPLSEASTACPSPKQLREARSFRHPGDAKERQTHAYHDLEDMLGGAAHGDSDCELSDSSQGSFDAGDGDNLDDMEDGVFVSEDEMQARVADAMRGLDRLQRMNIDERELPTIRALYVRWSIAQWALQGQKRTHSPAIPPSDSLDGQQQEVAEADIGKVATCAVRVGKRVRGESDSHVAEETQLGHIRGPGCRTVKAHRVSVPSGENQHAPGAPGSYTDPSFSVFLV